LKKILSILVISGLIFSTTQVFGQQLTVGIPPVEDIRVTLDEKGTAHVVHVVKGDKTEPVQVEAITGNMTNFSVTDKDGNSVQYSTLSRSPTTVLIMPTDRNMTFIKYDLPNIVSNKNGVWEWKYFEPSDTTFTDFYFPKGVDVIWTYDTPVYLGQQGLRQHGNGFSLHYVINEPVTNQNVQWQDKSFDVGIRTVSGLGSYVFDQSQKTYAFDINTSKSFITVIMPQELLWGPYQVTINGNKTLHKEYYNNGTHVWIGLRPASSGTVQITGTTVVPEFPLFVPLAIALLAVVALRFTSKLNFH
jgi:hypothetical protein